MYGMREYSQLIAGVASATGVPDVIGQNQIFLQFLYLDPSYDARMRASWTPQVIPKLVTERGLPTHSIHSGQVPKTRSHDVQTAWVQCQP